MRKLKLSGIIIDILTKNNYNLNELDYIYFNDDIEMFKIITKRIKLSYITETILKYVPREIIKYIISNSKDDKIKEITFNIELDNLENKDSEYIIDVLNILINYNISYNFQNIVNNNEKYLDYSYFDTYYNIMNKLSNKNNCQKLMDIIKHSDRSIMEIYKNNLLNITNSTIIMFYCIINVNINVNKNINLDIDDSYYKEFINEYYDNMFIDSDMLFKNYPDIKEIKKEFNIFNIYDYNIMFDKIDYDFNLLFSQ
jgi:hypothetical protein